MTIATLMVHMELERSNAARVSVAATLAERFDAFVIGVAACEPQPPKYFDGVIPDDVIRADRERARDQMSGAEKAIRDAMTGRANKVEWRSAFAHPTQYVARNARAADIVITGCNPPREYLDPSWRLDTGELVVTAGRPVLVVPDAVDRLSASRIVVGWKDTREARRALKDALPFLVRADAVFVACAVEDKDLGTTPDGLTDVAAWLQRHHVHARTKVVSECGEPGMALEGVAVEEGADLIVAGAYGHSRVREWVSGGVTRDLVTRATVCSLLSH